jgi:hypothetical protein
MKAARLDGLSGSSRDGSNIGGAGWGKSAAKLYQATGNPSTDEWLLMATKLPQRKLGCTPWWPDN